MAFSLSPFPNLFFFPNIFEQSILGISKMDKKNVQKSKSQNTLPKKTWSVTIIDFYGLVTKKIIFKMLR
jgi:hypothetical protein